MHSYLQHLPLVAFLASTCSTASATTIPPEANDSSCNVTYTGISQDGVENFFGIAYGQDTGGAHRFRPPRPFAPTSGSIIDATSRGPACPQPKGNALAPLYLSNITETSEDCLHLNIYRPKGTTADDKLPVILIIHGGALIGSSKDELLFQPAGLILQSLENGMPVLCMTINYRLGAFGFAQSCASKQEGSTNAGLRDQRLAIHWARDNIAHFGGDPSRITILGQSSGGHAVGMQLLAYGGHPPAPFHQAMAESQFLDVGITGNFTWHAMQKLVAATGCHGTADMQSAELIHCLRNLGMDEILAAQTRTYGFGPAENAGDVWLPAVDGDFLPAAPSKLIAEGRFHSVPTIVDWTENDGVFFVGNPTSEADVFDFYRQYLPGFSVQNLRKLLSLYPVSDFDHYPTNVSAQVYRSGRILRDVVQTCQPLHFARAIHNAGKQVYVYEQNQSILDEVLLSVSSPALGPVHTAELAYVFGNLSHYNVNGFPFHPTPSDFALRDRESRSWAIFASIGKPSLAGHRTLQSWNAAFRRRGEVAIFVVGGPHEGLSAIDGSGSSAALRGQKLRERCAFLNSPEIIEQLKY